MSSVDRLFDTFDDLRKNAQVNAVFGRPKTVGKRTIIPIAQISYGFGLGFGEGTSPGEEGKEDTGTGAGGGGRVTARPIGVLEVTPDGTQVESVVDEGQIALAGMALTAWAVFLVTRALIKIFGQE
ncbi:MAG: spore germination protein GerW family protein [Chloroflexota bacterium]|nr:spore germination protein GerW family protein [Chloroflexota bacterium]